MQTKNRNTYTTIRSEGALLPVDILQRIQENDPSLEGLSPQGYYLAPGEKLNEAINRSWNRMSVLWKSFQAVREQMGEGDPATGVTRERWLLPLFQELGYGRLLTSRAVEIDGKSYPISHHWNQIPLHLIGCGLKLDKITPGAAGAARFNPHAMLQEYLNRTENAQWGLVTNGLILRLLRDNASLTRQAYLEFDLELMFNGEVYADFVVLWLVCHSSRFASTESDPECLLEKWSKTAQEHGTRALDDLRKGVEEAIRLLGQGFLQHPENETLRRSLQTGSLDKLDYYRQVLRLVYRLIFLFTAEDRGLLLDPKASEDAKQRYRVYYSTETLRQLAQKQRGSRHHDRYEILRLVMEKLASDEGSPELALPALGGLLFSQKATSAINLAKISNQVLLAAVRSLSYITEGKIRRTVDYRNLGPEELGSVYESLLELHPDVNTQARTFSLTSAAGNERKTSGSYYTPSSLIKVLLDSALEPVIEEAVRDISRNYQSKTGDAKSAKDSLTVKENFADLAASRLLSLKICDPACGSGHFLIAAAHRLAGRLASIRTNGSEPSPEENRAALRDVIRRCIYGVDLNPMAVELCKVNLWLESIEPGKPLSFLDAHIQCGNSLVGVGPTPIQAANSASLKTPPPKNSFAGLASLRLNHFEIPDEAFNPVTGDHKPTANYLKRRNKAERAGNIVILPTTYVATTDGENVSDLSLAMERINNLPEDTAEQVRIKEIEYTHLVETQRFNEQKTACDLWTAAFFWQMTEQPGEADVFAPTQGLLQRFLADNPIPEVLLEKVNHMADEINFFHWELRFPEVFPNMPDQHTGENGGFDCVLGNPPWERIKLQEQEFFASRDPEIANAPNAAARGRLIKQLPETNPALAESFLKAKHEAECASKFVRSSDRFPLTAVGDVNTYALFAEHFRDLLNQAGHSGIIVPTGIATDDTTKAFFGDLVEKQMIATLFDFENREKLFPAVDSRMKFCLLTLSNTPVEQSEFIFFATRVEHLRDPMRRFSLKPEEIALFNPNTRTMPVFRTRMDAELTRKIYQRVPVLVNERTGENPWGVSFMRMFDMANDSKLFSDHPKPGYVPLYEAKMFWHYDHRWNTYENGATREYTIEEKKDFLKTISPRYWIKYEDVNNRLSDWKYYWLIGFRDVTNATNERTTISSVIPRVGVGHKAPLIFLSTNLPIAASISFLGILNSIVLDFIARQKIGGTSLSYFILKQLPFLLPYFTKKTDEFIHVRVVELIYTASDLTCFAKDMGYEGEPFIWDEDRRANLRAELDAYYAYLYGLDRDELRYILDPQDVYGPDFPGETFRVLKDKEIRQYGEYRTRRLVLEAWDRMVADGTITPGERPVIETPQPAPVHEVQKIKEEKPIYAEKAAAAPKAVKPKQENPDQLGFSGMGLTKCSVCGALVMSFDQGNHINEVHGGQAVEFVKVG